MCVGLEPRVTLLGHDPRAAPSEEIVEPPTGGGTAMIPPERDEIREPPDRSKTSARERMRDGTRRGLLADEELEEYRTRWEAVQVRFVDEPQRSVEEADALVTDLMRRLTETFADERASLEAGWEKGEEVSTEELRIALQRYRSFFDRLLAA
jgi:hypothetical protein